MGILLTSMTTADAYSFWDCGRGSKAANAFTELTRDDQNMDPIITPMLVM